MKQKLIRITTVPISLDKLLSGQLAYMSQFYKVIGVSSEKKYLEKIGKKENIEVFHLEMTRQITPIKDLIAVYKLYIFLKKEKPYIVHTHTPKAGIVGMLASKIAGVPIRLHTIAGLPLLEHSGFKRKLLNFVEKLTYDCATKVYPNSYELQKIIIASKLCKSNRSEVIANGSSNGINTTTFNPKLFSENDNNNLRNKLKIALDDFVFIFVGRLVSDKGINEMIKAFEKLQIDTKNIKLLLVGDYETNLDPLSPATLMRINHNPSIITVGYQEEVRPYFAISDTLVFPSYREGFPNVVMQAGAMGLPSIVSDINGCNEIISNYENGIIVPVKNTDALFVAMQEVIRTPNLQNEMKQKSRPMIVSRFEQNVVWEALLHHYRKFENQS